MEVIGCRDEIVALAAAVSRRASCIVSQAYTGPIALEPPRLDATTRQLVRSIRDALLDMAGSYYDISGTADPRLGALAAPRPFGRARLLDPGSPDTLARLPELYAARASADSQQLAADWCAAAWRWVARFRYLAAPSAHHLGRLAYTRAADGTKTESVTWTQTAFGALFGAERDALHVREDGPTVPGIYGATTNIRADAAIVQGAVETTDTTSASFGVGAYAENWTQHDAQLVLVPYLGAAPSHREYRTTLVGAAATGAPGPGVQIWYQPGGDDVTDEILEWFAGAFLRVRLAERRLRQSGAGSWRIGAETTTTDTYYTQTGTDATPGAPATTTDPDVGPYYATPTVNDSSEWLAFDSFGALAPGVPLLVGTVPARGTLTDTQFIAVGTAREPTAYPTGFFDPGPSVAAPSPVNATSVKNFQGRFRLLPLLDFGTIQPPPWTSTQNT